MRRNLVVLVVAMLALVSVTGHGLVRALGWAFPQAAAELFPGDDFLIARAARVGHNTPSVAYDDDLDVYLVVWSDSRNGSNSSDILGQLISSAGVPLGDNFAIRDEATHQLLSPAVAYDTVNERYLVVWKDADEYEIEGQMLNADGTLYHPAFNLILGSTSNEPMEPVAACYAHATDGVCTVAYSRGAPGEGDIHSQRVDVEGGATGPEIDICTHGADQRAPDIAVNPATGDFLVVWNDERAPIWSIRGRVQDRDGGLGEDFAISTSTSIDRFDPAVTFVPDAGSDGEWLVVFYRETATETQIAGRRVTAAGLATGDLLHICTDEGNQFYVAVAYNSNSQESLVIWADDHLEATYLEIYGRRVDLEGAPVGNSFRVGAASGTQHVPVLLPVVAASPAAPGYLAVFDADIGDLQGQRVGVDGALQGHEIAIAAPANDQTKPAVGYNSNLPGYLVVWQDLRGEDWDIWGQRVDLYGVVQEPNLAICSEDGNQITPAVAHSPDTDQYLVVWQDARSGATQIYGQRVDGDGDLSEDEFLIAGGDDDARRNPRVVFNPVMDEFLVVYTHGVESGNIRGRRVPASGLPAEAEFDIATGEAEQTFPDVACRAQEGRGGYLVVWRELDGAQHDIVGQRLKPNTGSLGDVLDVCSQEDDQWHPLVVYSPDADGYLVLWPDDRNVADQGRDIYARPVSGTGQIGDELAVTTAAADQAHLDAAYSAGLGSYVVVWDDDRSAASGPDIYGQRISTGGALEETDAATNELLFEFSGWQQYPGLAWDDEESLGLVVWQDGRNGDNFDIYGLGLRSGLTEYEVFLPLLQKAE